MLLSMLKVGEQAKVLQLNNSSQMIKRLNDMGITTGVNLKIVRCAPFYGPIELEVRGFNLAIRYLEAQKIIVEKRL